MKNSKYFFNTLFSKAYWQYVLISKKGISSILAIFGMFYLIIESLDFFKVYTRDQYASYSLFIFIILSILLSVSLRRPIKSFTLPLTNNESLIEVKIANLFDQTGAVMISTNSDLEADVAGGKIHVNSLQGQFTAKYYTGNQISLINKINSYISKNEMTVKPYEMGTIVPIETHGQTFYFTVMADLNEKGNSFTSIDNIKKSLNGLWNYVNECGELQELSIPVLGTGRGRLKTSRKKMISIIVESFIKASQDKKIADKLKIVIYPPDANKFSVNLYDIKDNLKHLI